MIHAKNGAPLTQRELEVAKMAAAGDAVKQIAGELGISYFTVKAHLRAVYEKLGIHDRVRLAILFHRAQDAGSEAA